MFGLCFQAWEVTSHCFWIDLTGKEQQRIHHTWRSVSISTPSPTLFLHLKLDLGGGSKKKSHALGSRFLFAYMHVCQRDKRGFPPSSTNIEVCHRTIAAVGRTVLSLLVMLWLCTRSWWVDQAKYTMDSTPLLELSYGKRGQKVQRSTLSLSGHEPGL